MNRKLWVSVTLVLLLAVGTGCGQKPQAAPADNAIDGSAINSTNGNGASSAAGQAGDEAVTDEGTEGKHNGGQDVTEQTVTDTIETYYADEQMLDLIKSSAKITYTEESEKYMAALETLKKSSTSDAFALWEKIVFHSAKLENGQLTIDITIPDEARLGAGGEVMALDALKQTMFQFDEVKSIELLVDGKQTESLMGHEDLEHPMTRK